MSIILHPGQSEVFTDLFVERTIRNAVVICSRGWGKSYLAATCGVAAIMELLQLDPRVPNKNVYIIAPTYAQVTDIYHPLIAYQLGMDAYALRHSKDLGRFWFPYNVELKLVSYEAIERLRGTGAYFTVMDEPASYTSAPGLQEAWQGIVQPTMSTRWSEKRAKIFKAVSPGRSLTISTPKGYTYLYDMYNYQEVDKSWKSYHFDYKTSPYLDPEEIEEMRHTYDPLQFAREYLASFEESGNNVFYCFDRKVHVRGDLPEFTETEDVHIGIDFNVGLQCSSVFAIRGGQQHFLDEFKGHPDTETLANGINARYKSNKRKIYVYPDPTGKSRKTSAPVGRTDFSILEAAGLIVRSRNASPSIADSVNAVNRQLKTAAGEMNMFFHPRVQGVIQSMERTKWKDSNPNSLTIDKEEGVEHFSDSIRYPTEYLFPVLAARKRSVRGFQF